MGMSATTMMRFAALATVSVGALAAVAAPSLAGGFAVREQSATHQGASFAGNAAGNDLSAMFWNPAAVTNKAGMNSESHVSAIIGDSEITTTGGSLQGLTALGQGTESGNIASPALLSASYINYQINDQLYVGMSMNAPFGLTTKPDFQYVGESLGRTSRLRTVNAAPTIGYKIMPGLSVAAGIQVQYIDTRLSSVLSNLPTANSALGTLVVEGDDIGVGYTLGVMFQPTSATSIGLGFRSSIDHTLEGDQSNALGSSDITADAELPEIVTLSFRQALSPDLRLMGTVEWSNWSRVQTIDIICDGVDGAACLAEGQTLSTLALNYDDGWFFSGGLEYDVSPTIMMRAGYAYEISPASDDESRTVRLADNDRHWFSLGASAMLTDTMKLDLSYTHIIVEDGGIDQEDEISGATLEADVQSNVNIFSAAIKMPLGGLFGGHGQTSHK